MTSRSGSRPPSSDYAVGYGRPPTATRFKPGQSGNPKGRRKGERTIHEIITRLLARRVSVTAEGVAKRMSLIEVTLTTIVNNAAKGDLKAAAFLVRLQQPTPNIPAEDAPSRDLVEEDKALLEHYLGQLQQPGPSGTNEDPGEPIPDNPEAGAEREPQLRPDAPRRS